MTHWLPRCMQLWGSTAAGLLAQGHCMAGLLCRHLSESLMQFRRTVWAAIVADIFIVGLY